MLFSLHFELVLTLSERVSPELDDVFEQQRLDPVRPVTSEDFLSSPHNTARYIRRYSVDTLLWPSIHRCQSYSAEYFWLRHDRLNQVVLERTRVHIRELGQAVEQNLPDGQMQLIVLQEIATQHSAYLVARPLIG